MPGRHRLPWHWVEFFFLCETLEELYGLENFTTASINTVASRKWVKFRFYMCWNCTSSHLVERSQTNTQFKTEPTRHEIHGSVGFSPANLSVNGFDSTAISKMFYQKEKRGHKNMRGLQVTLSVHPPNNLL